MLIKINFIANPTPQPTAPIPTKIYTRTNLFDNKLEDSNPLVNLRGQSICCSLSKIFRSDE